MANSEKIAAPSGAEPYVVIRLSVFAAASRRAGTRFGTLASLAGFQNRLTHSIRSDAMSSQVSVPTNGMDRNNPNRRMSATTIVNRRSSRSATTPANGPRISAGSSRTISTEPMANALSEKLARNELARAVVASRPIQSPRLDRASASQSRRNCAIRRTARKSPSVC